MRTMTIRSTPCNLTEIQTAFRSAACLLHRNHGSSRPRGISILIHHPRRLATLAIITLLPFMATTVADQSADIPSDVIVDAVIVDAVNSDDDSSTDPASSKTTQSQANRKKADSRDERLSRETEQAAINFAQQHHPTMASLVKKLRNRDSNAYGKAIRELSVDSLRLTRLKERQPQRFQSELDLWKLDSEIRMQLARWSVASSERLESNIRRLLTRRRELRQQRLVTEKERLQSRIEQIDQQLNLRGPALKEDIEREWAKLTRRLRPATDKSTARKKSSNDSSKSDSKKTNGSDSKSGKNKTSGAEKPQDTERNPTTQRP